MPTHSQRKLTRQRPEPLPLHLKLGSQVSRRWLDHLLIMFVALDFAALLVLHV